MSDISNGSTPRSRAGHPALRADLERVVMECPLCGERMRIKSREVADRIPGQSQVVRREVREWTCPECDYYEDVDDNRAPG